MKTFQYIICRLKYLLTWVCGFFVYAHCALADLENDIKDSVGDIIPNVDAGGDVDEAQIFHETQTFIFEVIGIISVVMILYTGVKFMLSKGNLEEFKQEAKALIYIVGGLALIPLSYFLVKYITNLRL